MWVEKKLSLSLQVGNNNYNVLSGSNIGMTSDQTFPATRTEIEHGGDQASGEVVTSQQQQQQRE